MKQKALETIPIDTVSFWMDKEESGKDGETWKAWLINNDSTHSYVKIPHNSITIIAELAASQVGRAIDLKIPPPYLVQVDTEDADYPEESIYRNTGLRFAFACGACGPQAKSFERISGIRDDLIDGWPDLETTMAFDEWIANTDRNLGNVIYDTSTRSYWLIDHGRALTDLTSLFAYQNIKKPSFQITNLIASTANGCDSDTANKIKQLSNKLMLKCTTIDIGRLDHNDHFKKIATAISKDDLADFLQKRIQHTTELLCKNIGHPMITLR